MKIIINIMKSRRIILFLYSLICFSLSFNFVFAKTFAEMVNSIVDDILSPIALLLSAVGVVSFIYGVFKFVKSDGKEKETGKEFLIWGLVAIFVMLSLWGIVAAVRNTLGL